MTESESTKSRLPRPVTLVLIAVVLLIGGGVLMVWVPYHRNQAAIVEVEKLGGTAYSEIVRPAWIPDFVDDGYLWVFEKVNSIEFSDIRISDTELRHLQGLNSLELITLDNTQVSNAGLEHLRGLTNLETLYLNYTQVSDVGLECLRGLSELEHLTLDNTQVSNAGLDHLLGLTKLKGLSLGNTHVTQAGIDKLQKALPHCKIYWTPPAE